MGEKIEPYHNVTDFRRLRGCGGDDLLFGDYHEALVAH